MDNRFKEAEHRFWNRFPRNPTQTMYNRFFKTPKAEMKTMFTESADKYNKIKNNINRDRLKTAYSEFLRR